MLFCVQANSDMITARLDANGKPVVQDRYVSLVVVNRQRSSMLIRFAMEDFLSFTASAPPSQD